MLSLTFLFLVFNKMATFPLLNCGSLQFSRWPLKDYNSQAGRGPLRLAHEPCTVAAGWAGEATLLTAKPPERDRLSSFSRKSVNSLGETGHPKARRWDLTVAAVVFRVVNFVFSPTIKRSCSKLSRRGVLSFRMSDWDKGVLGGHSRRSGEW